MGWRESASCVKEVQGAGIYGVETPPFQGTFPVLSESKK